MFTLHDTSQPEGNFKNKSKINILETKKFEFRENIFLRDRVLTYGHFAKGIKGNGLYNSEKSWERSQSLAPKNGPKTWDLL